MIATTTASSNRALFAISINNLLYNQRNGDIRSVAAVISSGARQAVRRAARHQLKQLSRLFRICFLGLRRSKPGFIVRALKKKSPRKKLRRSRKEYIRLRVAARKISRRLGNQAAATHSHRSSGYVLYRNTLQLVSSAYNSKIHPSAAQRGVCMISTAWCWLGARGYIKIVDFNFVNPELLYYLYAVAVAAGTFFSEIGGVQRSNYILLSGLSPELVPHVVGCFLGGAVVKKQNTTLL